MAPRAKEQTVVRVRNMRLLGIESKLGGQEIEMDSNGPRYKCDHLDCEILATIRGAYRRVR